jgi:hypothetical protein
MNSKAFEPLEVEEPPVTLQKYKLQNADYNNSVYRFGPIISICYLAANIYTFTMIFNYWNNFNGFMLAFSGVHLIVPVYTFALSFDQSSIV